MIVPNLPNDETGEALNRLQLDGSDLEKLMNIDFYVFCPNQQQAEIVSEKLSDHFLGTEIKYDQDDNSESWTCYFGMSMIPSYENVSSVEEKIDEICNPYGAYSDGFGSFGNA